MKKILVLMFTIVFCVNFAFAKTSQNDKLSEIENYLIGYSNPNLSQNVRIEKIEKEAYGLVKSGDIKTRIDTLYNDLELATKKSSDKKTFDEDENKISENNVKDEVYKQENSQNNSKKYNKKNNKKLSKYEKSLFNQDFTNLSDEQRVSQLEQSIFGRQFNDENLDARIERIVTVQKAQKSNSVYNENKFQKYLSTGVQVASIVLLILAMVL